MNRDQVRARNAFGFVPARLTSSPADFLQLVRKLPVMLQTNGLLATWAYLLAKEKKDRQDIAKALLEHLRDSGVAPASASRDARAVFLNDWTGPQARLGTGELRRLTAEAIIYAGWLKRAAEAVCDTGPTGASARESGR